MADKYSAVWVSHSSMGDFDKCPRMYFCKNIYKNPRTGKKINIVSPHLTLGVAVHEVLEGLGQYPAESRLKQRDLEEWFNAVWKLGTGKRGGFTSEAQEAEFYERGLHMIRAVKGNPRFLTHKIIKLPRETMNPNFYLSEEKNIILNGLIDWIEYLPETDSLHIVDFKTGKNVEREDSMQLPIYLLLCDRLQKRKVTKASYWYLEHDEIVEKKLPTVADALAQVMPAAERVAEARSKKEFPCLKGELGCSHCKPFEAILALHRNEQRDDLPEYVGIGNFGQELYLSP